MFIRVMPVRSAAALGLALLSTAAFAADLPSRRAPPVFAPPPPIPVFTWTGVYVGGQVGYNFGRDNAFASSTITGGGLASGGASNRGVIGGAHVGYNFSTQSLPVFGSLFGSTLGTGGVVGIEGDVDGSSARANYALGGLATSSRDNVQGSVRGRLGVAVDRALFYATGGVAFGGLQNTYVNTLNGLTDNFSKTRGGLYRRWRHRICRDQQRVAARGISLHRLRQQHGRADEQHGIRCGGAPPHHRQSRPGRLQL